MEVCGADAQIPLEIPDTAYDVYCGICYIPSHGVTYSLIPLRVDTAVHDGQSKMSLTLIDTEFRGQLLVQWTLQNVALRRLQLHIQNVRNKVGVLGPFLAFDGEFDEQSNVTISNSSFTFAPSSSDLFLQLGADFTMSGGSLVQIVGSVFKMVDDASGTVIRETNIIATRLATEQPPLILDGGASIVFSGNIIQVSNPLLVSETAWDFSVLKARKGISLTHHQQQEIIINSTMITISDNIFKMDRIVAAIVVWSLIEIAGHNFQLDNVSTVNITGNNIRWKNSNITSSSSGVESFFIRSGNLQLLERSRITISDNTISDNGF